MNQIPENTAFDPLGYGVALPLETVLYPLGFRMQLQTNSAHVIQAAKGQWADFPPLIHDRTIEIRVAVSGDGPETRFLPLPLPRYPAEPVPLARAAWPTRARVVDGH